MIPHFTTGRACRLRNLTVIGVALTLIALVPAAQAAPVSLSAPLSGAAENPPNASPGSGSALVILDMAAHILEVNVTFDDLIGTTTASHIHCCTLAPANVGVATTVPTFAGFPLGVTSGTYHTLLDLTLVSSYNPAFISAHGGTVAGAEADLAAGLLAGQAYLNVHTTAFPGGEIRGFLSPVPEPTSLGLLAVGVAGLVLARRFARR